MTHNRQIVKYRTVVIFEIIFAFMGGLSFYLNVISMTWVFIVASSACLMAIIVAEEINERR